MGKPAWLVIALAMLLTASAGCGRALSIAPGTGAPDAAGSAVSGPPGPGEPLPSGHGGQPGTLTAGGSQQQTKASVAEDKVAAALEHLEQDVRALLEILNLLDELDDADLTL